MLIGYARVSTQDQSPELQTDALKAVGCKRIFSDTATGSRDDRPALAEALCFARTGDVLVVWRLDRLGRSLKHLISVIANLAAAGVEFRSLTESIDTTTAAGRFFFHIFGAVAEFERELIRERTLAGLSVAKSRGRKGGRRASLTLEQMQSVYTLVESGLSYPEVAAQFEVSKYTIARAYHLVENAKIAQRAATRLLPSMAEKGPFASSEDLAPTTDRGTSLTHGLQERESETPARLAARRHPAVAPIKVSRQRAG